VSWTVASVVRRWSAEAGDRPALTFEDVDRTWSELHADAGRVANALSADGVRAQDRVAIIDKNTPAHFQLLFGASLINAVYVAVNWRLAPAEMAKIVNDAEAAVLIVGDAFLAQLEAFEDQLTSQPRILVAGGGHGKHGSMEDWMAAQPTSDPGHKAGDSDVALQLYTSGTTGLPKGVMLTNANLGVAVPSLGPELSVTADSVSLVAMPLFHIGGSGWALAGMSHGARSVLLREVDPVAILKVISTYGVTHAFLVPAVLMFLLSVRGVEETDFSSVQYIAYGASPISEDTLIRCLEVMRCQFVQLYGLTETTGAITILRADQHDPRGPRAGRLRSCGVANPSVTLRITNPDDGIEVGAGKVGEIWVRSEQNMLGYWRQPAETDKTLTADGWLRTGDAGYVDADGFLYLHDRIKDMIVSGGENIYPAEVENALMSHPAVADAAVIGVPDDRWGETVKAIVACAPGSNPTAAELIAHCRRSLAPFKCPTSVDFTDGLPRNPSGKILKRELREPYWAGQERRVH
jgi:long-chain acyl-CoA synthetase